MSWSYSGQNMLWWTGKIGFYDFLRDRDGTVIGIRLSLFTTTPMLQSISRLQYVYVHKEGRYLEMFFREHRNLAVDTPAEQAFGDDALWCNSLGVYALQVGTTELSTGDLDGLRQAVRPLG